MSEEEGEKYILHFKATQLRKKTPTLSLSSPSFHTFAVISLRDSAHAEAVVLGSTEIIENNQNPEWTTPVVVPFRFEKLQEISVRVYLTSDTTSKEEREEALIGQFKFPLPSLLYAIRGLRGALVHDSHREQGQVLVRGESLYETREVFGGGFSLHLDAPLSGGFFSTRECFLTLSRLNEDESWTMVWRGSKSSLPSSSPSEEVSLGQTRLSLASLCNGDVRRPLRLQLWEFHPDGRHEVLGHVTTNTHSITASSAVTLKLIDDKDKTKQLGHVIAQDCRIESAATFSQYVQGGCEISLLVAIDFTYSNGNPKDPTSLHYLPSLSAADLPPSKGAGSPVDRLNPYQEAIQAVGKILQQYDADNMYPVFGFGAQTLGRDGKFSMTSHCFNLHPEEKEVKGIEGVLALYEEAMTRLKFSSPTYFTEIIEEACVIAGRTQCNQESQKYFILLILTDGVINDMESTIEAVVAASALPLSIIIIGIDRPGDADNFDKMRVLDSDDKLLQHGDLTAHRDIVQFVPFSRFFSRGMQSLAEEVLEEIPDQLVGYMEEKRIVPNVPTTTSDK